MLLFQLMTALNLWSLFFIDLNHALLTLFVECFILCRAKSVGQFGCFQLHVSLWLQRWRSAMCQGYQSSNWMTIPLREKWFRKWSSWCSAHWSGKWVSSLPLIFFPISSQSSAKNPHQVLLFPRPCNSSLP